MDHLNYGQHKLRNLNGSIIQKAHILNVESIFLIFFWLFKSEIFELNFIEFAPRKGTNHFRISEY